MNSKSEIKTIEMIMISSNDRVYSLKAITKVSNRNPQKQLLTEGYDRYPESIPAADNEFIDSTLKMR